MMSVGFAMNSLKGNWQNFLKKIFKRGMTSGMRKAIIEIA